MILMTHPDQYMIYHLVSWNQEKNKWNKKPVGLQGEPLHTDSGIPTSVDRESVIGTVNSLGQQYRLGLWLAAQSNFFFLDLDDNAVQIVNGQSRLTPFANALAAPFIAAGCYFEASTSGRGAHVIGRYSGVLQPFATSRKRVHPHEFFVRDRGVVLNCDAHAGSWDVDASYLLPALLTEHFPPRHADDEVFEFSDIPRAEWRGPADDDELIRKFLSAAGSAAARLRGSTSLADLWNGNCQHTSESDLALASHLAFWTGCAAARIERLMRRSPLAVHRLDKWDSHRTYLRELTITEACVTTKTVYREPERVDTAAALLGTGLRPLTPPTSLIGDPLSSVTASVDWFDQVEQFTTLINSAGTHKELMTDVVSTIAAAGMPRLHGDTVVSCMQRKLDTFGIRHSVGHLRSLLMPPTIAESLITQVVPEWAASLIYVLQSDKFFDTITGSTYTHQGLKMQFQRHMPMKPTGAREDPVQWLMDRWNITSVDDLEYRPDQPPVFQFASRTFGNLFRASTMPTPVIGSAECSACIQLFLQHLYAVVNRRDHLYAALLGWIAHNVQRPGVKILWSPLIKGVQGDGKSIFGELLRNAMGHANVKVTSSSSISNKGGFTDWASGKAVNVIEEIKLEGKEARAMYNNMKTLIGDRQIDLNRKGRISGDNLENVSNHWANTQHADAIPLETGERRWLIVFTPWDSAASAAAIKGLASADDLPSYFQRLGVSMRTEPGAWRSWLMGIDLSAFNANGRALWTQERDTMMSGSEDFVEQTVRDCIERGGTGITKDVFCSAHLFGRVQVELSEKPDTRTWNKTLTHLGYQQITRLEWLGKTRRIWAKREMINAEVIEILNTSAMTR